MSANGRGGVMEYHIMKLDEDALEAAYWIFDARQKGYGNYEGIRADERYNFKMAVREAAAQISVKHGAQFGRSHPSI